jgi:hypothetical protein
VHARGAVGTEESSESLRAEINTDSRIDWRECKFRVANQFDKQQ